MSKLNLTINGKDLTDVEKLKAKITDTDNYAEFVNTDDATAKASDIAQGKTAYVKGNLVTGTGSGGGSDFVCASTQMNDLSSIPSLNSYMFEIRKGVFSETNDPSMDEVADFFTGSDVRVWFRNTNAAGNISPVTVEYRKTVQGTPLVFTYEKTPGIYESNFFYESYFSSLYIRLTGLVDGKIVSDFAFEHQVY